MIQVTSPFPYRRYEVDADDATMIGAKGEPTLLVLTKDGIEVAWFNSWANAVKVDNLRSTEDLAAKEEINA